MKVYLNIIRNEIPAGMDARHVLAFIMSGRQGGYSNMSSEEWSTETKIGVGCVNTMGAEYSERAAKRCGL